MAGFWIVQVKSRVEALEWAWRIPFRNGEVVEIRQVFETEDFPAEVMPAEEKGREQALRAELEKRK